MTKVAKERTDLELMEEITNLAYAVVREENFTPGQPIVLDYLIEKLSNRGYEVQIYSHGIDFIKLSQA